MTKKDFEFIAAVIRSLPEEARVEAAHAFAKALQVTNPRFDAARFGMACQPKENQ